MLPLKFNAYVQLLSLLTLAQVWLSVSQFVFEFELDPRSVTANFNCADGLGDSEVCTTYFSIFCLREGRDTQTTNTGDCPLGSSKRLNAYDERLSSPQTRRITSPRPWPVTFQLYIKARDFDDGLIIDLPIDTDDDLDDIFINRALEVNTSFTAMEEYTGILNRVSVQMRFRVTCQQDYYGADCSTFCVAQNDDLNGYYTCNSDGSIQCLEDFENPQNNCRDMAQTDIDDCVSAICPNNSMCVDGVNSYECVCYPSLELDVEGRCVSISMGNQDKPELYGLAVAVAVTVAALIILTVALVIVIVKCQRRKKIQCVSQDLVATPDLIINNSMCGNGTIFQAAKDGTLRDVQNPIYGDDTDDNSARCVPLPRDHLYAIAKPPQPQAQAVPASDSLLSTGEKEQPRYNYAANGAAPEYAVVKTKSKDKVTIKS